MSAPTIAQQCRMSRIDCSRCGVRVETLRTTGKVRSHQCPHGFFCVRSHRSPAPSRGNRWRLKRCPECFAKRQLSLPLENRT